MSASPIYSRRFASRQNWAGNFNLLNPGPDLYIVRTVTFFYGGLGQSACALNDDVGCGMLVAELGPLTSSTAVWETLHLVWDPGATWQISTSLGTDWSIHGYALSPP